MEKVKYLCALAMMLVCAVTYGQQINILPTMMPAGGSFDDNVTITCTFPEGCSNGVYWINGGELRAQRYEGPITLDYSCVLSVAGTNAEGRIITDVVTREFTINRVTPPYYTVQPKEGVRKESFYVTRIKWNNITSSDLRLDDFKEGKPRHGEKVVWLTNAQGQVIAQNDYNGIWIDQLNQFKAYLYYGYNVTTPGNYVLHIAKGVFVLDGEVYDDEVQLHYEVADKLSVPEFSPEEGEYTGPLTVSISYPDDGSAFYQFYKINGAKAKSYTGPFTITETSTIQAYGMDEDFTGTTEVATATYTIIEPQPEPEPLAAPTINRMGNTFTINGPQGATLKYWLNDNMNTARLYEGAFEVTNNGRLSCVAYTDAAVSQVVNIDITGFTEDRGEQGDLRFTTPDGLETVHLRSLSPNGRFAVGFTGSDTSSKGFIWDLTADKLQFPSTVFVNQLWDISNDGTAFGWRLVTSGIGGSEEEIEYAVCKNGNWTPCPKEMNVKGITGDGELFGSKDGKPATYNITTGEYTYYKYNNAETEGELTVAKDSGIGGWAMVNGKHTAMIWTASDNAKALDYITNCDDATIRQLSADGQWAVVGDRYRVNISEGKAERLISTADRYHNTVLPEVMTDIANDGTIFGTYDASLLSREAGVAMVYSTDGRWRRFSDWLLDNKNLRVENARLTSVRAVNGDASIVLLHSMSLGESESDAFTHGTALLIDVKVKHLAPVNVKAENIIGTNTVKVSWDAPITDGDKVTTYTLYRDGNLLTTVGKDTKVYYDANTEYDTPYTYTMTATYDDAVVSDYSYEASVCYASTKYRPARSIAVRPVGLSDLSLSWQAPVTSIPKLQYFNEEADWLAFGTAGYNSEWGIRISASDLEVFEGQQIRTFQFLPSGPQKAYKLNLYRGTSINGRYEKTPFYTQNIDPANINYGSVNTVELTTPQELPQGVDLYVGLYIEGKGTDDMLGISYEGFKGGYTDLCRIEDVFEQMVSIAEFSTETTEIVLPLGIGICTEDGYNGNIISNYLITDNNETIGTTTSTRFQMENVSEGEHELGVVVVYKDGVESKKATVDIDMKKNEKAYVAVEDIDITPNTDGTALLSWKAPLDEDRTDIHWGNLTPQQGWVVPESVEGFFAASVFPVTMTSEYANDYEITEVFFCPGAEATFSYILDDSNNTIIASGDIENVEIGKINYIKLEEPVTVDPSINYELTIMVDYIEPGTAPLCYDTSNIWQDGYSNLINYGIGWGALSEIVQITEHPNWLLGMVLRKKDARVMPLDGYNVIIDGQKNNADMLQDNTYKTSVLTEGSHTAEVDVIYSAEKNVRSEATPFVISTDGNMGITGVAEDYADGIVYDLQGRRVITDRAGREVFIINGKKFINK